MQGYLRPLSNFAHVVDAGSLTAAANRLGVSPSVLSESVKTLEAYYGEPLLERHRRGVFPTSRGSEVARHARQIVTSLQEAMKQPQGDRLNGAISISIAAELALGWMDQAMLRLQAEHPDLSVAQRVEDRIADYTKFARDLYVRVGPNQKHPGLTTLGQSTVRVALVAAPALLANVDRSAPSEVEQLPCLTGKIGADHSVVPLRCPKGGSDGPGLQFKNLIQVSEVFARIALARAGLGVTACLFPTVAGDIAEGRLVDLFPERVGPEQIHVVIGSPHRRPPAKARKVAEILVKGMPGASRNL